jgi:hypothetical protein
MAPKGKKPGNMLIEWLVDNYDAPQLGGTVDGADVAAYENAAENRTRLKNYAQVFRRAVRVGFVAQEMNVAGLNKTEIANAVSKKLVELKRDMEATFLATNQAAQADNGSDPYLSASLGNWVNTNGSSVGQPTSTYDTPSTSKYTGTTAAMVEANVQAILTSIYNETGKIQSLDAIVGTTLKRAFTALTNAKSANNESTNTFTQTNVRTFNMELSSKAYISNVTSFEGDFGTLRLHPDTFVGHNDSGWAALPAKGYIIPFDMIELCYVSTPTESELPNSGGGPIRLIQAIAGLVVKNPLGFGFFDCSA